MDLIQFQALLLETTQFDDNHNFHLSTVKISISLGKNGTISSSSPSLKPFVCKKGI